MQTNPPLAARDAELRELGAKPDGPPMMTKLYRRAEARLRKLQKNLKHGGADSTGDPRQVHELQVHQIELEMQNAELREVRERTEALLEKYTDLYDFAPVGYFTLGSDGTVRQVNLTGAHMVGFERDQLVGQSFRTLVCASLRPAFNSFLKQVFAGQTKQSGEFVMSGKDQRARSVNIEARRSVNRHECRAAVMDITARKEAEDKLRVSEVRYRRLFEAAHDGVLLLDPGTRKITDANPFMMRLLGYPYDQLVGKELFEIGLLKDEAASREMFAKLKREHQVRYEDLPLETQRGRHQEVEVVANLYQENGHSVIQCNIRDITQRKEAEDVLRRNEALFSALVEQAPYGVYVVDSTFRLQQVNRTAQPVFSKVHPLIGRDLSEVLHILWPKRVAGEVVVRFRHTLKTGEPYHSLEFVARRRDIGLYENYEWQIQRVTMPAGELGVVCFFTDITERKRSEETQRRVDVLTASNRKLEQEIVRRHAVEQSLKESEKHQIRHLEQSRRLEEQLRHLSRQVLQAQEEERKRISRELHDVVAQTLTGINVRLANLKKEAMVSTKGLDRNIDLTQQMVEHAVSIVHRFARELRPSVLDDLGLIPALHTYVKALQKETGIRVGLSAFAAVEKVNGDKRTVLYRVAQEALTNVSRHAKASRVEVVIRKVARSVFMEIIDNGKGFQEDRLLQARNSNRLGLLGMKERLEMVGGVLAVTSAPGQGTTVQAQIPLDDVRARAPKTRLKSPIRSKKVNVQDL